MILLCTDRESVQQPELLNLEGENLSAQRWLEVQVNPLDAREAARATASFKEIWVISSENIEAINLAAALKKDHQHTPVYLVESQGSGSLKSRAKAAGLDAVITQKQMVERYQAYKKKPENSKDKVSMFSSAKAVPDVKAVSRSAIILPVLSATGGSGKSTISVLLACLAQRLGYDTLLIDADLQFGDARFLMNSPQSPTIDEVLANPALFGQIKTEGDIPALLAAPNRLEQSEIITTQLSALLGHCARQFEVIVVNTGAFWAEQHITLLERATRALFLLDQRPSSIRDCNHALQYCARCAVATQPIKFVLNRCSRNALFSSIDATCGLQGTPVVELQEGGRVVSELLGAGQPSDLIVSKNALCVSLENLMSDVLPNKRAKDSSPETKEGIAKAKRPRFWRKREAACL